MSNNWRRLDVCGIWSSNCEFFTCSHVEETVVGWPCVYAVLPTHSIRLGSQTGRSPKVENTGVKEFTLQKLKGIREHMKRLILILRVNRCVYVSICVLTEEWLPLIGSEESGSDRKAAPQRSE